MSTAWVKSSESVELRYVESGKPEPLPKPQNWLQQGLARINTKKRIKRYGTCSESLEDDSRLFLHQDYEEIPDYRKKHENYVPVYDKLSPSIYLSDGIRKIDYVLVFSENIDDARRRKNSIQGNKIANAGMTKQYSVETMTEPSKKELWRNQFLENIQNSGLQIEEEVVEQGKKAFVFLKIHATWPVLCHYAEELSMRAPLMLKTEKADLRNGSEAFLAYLNLPNPMKLNTPNEPQHFYTCPFRENKLHRFLGSNNKEKYFTTIQRIRIVNEVLSSAVFGKQRKGEVGIDRLVHEGVFAAAYPLHDGPYRAETDDGKVSVEDLNPRQILYEYWARWGRWYKYQPLDHIRNYFGEKVGLYFAWLGFYTSWLFPAAVVGILVFLYGLITVFDNPYANDVCEKPGKYKMCPQHEFGKYWDLYDICTYIRISYLFDHPGSVFYSIFISFWAVSFLEYWKRKCATIAYQWDCTDFQGEEEKPRAEYAAKAPFIAVNPVTGVREPAFPKGKRGKRIATGLGLVFVMISVVIIFIFAIIVFRIAIAIPLHNMNMTRGYAHTMANITGAGLNFIIIMIMSKFYEWLAQKLTRWEMHRTQSEYDDNYTFKVFVFQFVNFYSSIFYIAFFKGRFVGYPGNYIYIFNMRNEECEEGGCLIELAQQLAIIMIGKQVINNFMEIGMPWVKSWWLKTKARHKKCKHSTRDQIQEDYYTSPNEGLFQEYLEMVLQFGFITLFVAAFPLAPLFALLNNWVEIRLDAQKFVCHTRRGVPERTEDIGMWFKILQYLAHIAVITNGLLIAFTSRFLMKLLYQYEYNWSEEGYYDFILSWAPNGTYSEGCRYRGQRDEHGNYTMFFWKLLAVQFAFVLAFESESREEMRISDLTTNRTEIRITGNPIPEEEEGEEIRCPKRKMRSSRSDYEVPRMTRMQREPLSSEKLMYLNEKHPFRRMRNRSCQTERPKKKQRSSTAFEKLSGSTSSSASTSSDAFLSYPQNLRLPGQEAGTRTRSAASSTKSSFESLTQSEDTVSGSTIARRFSLNLEKRLRFCSGSRPRSWFGTCDQADV
ncbi:UNVERIFIED_CONTAM: hypothetical protein PYX00_008965 [Menopon gallinae]|uniref:Anoctamin n=1 Tax=Menopon gallinae TaxID=328185 RepID=A0AAW2H9L0_9NEOP